MKLKFLKILSHVILNHEYNPNYSNTMLYIYLVIATSKAFDIVTNM